MEELAAQISGDQSQAIQHDAVEIPQDGSSFENVEAEAAFVSVLEQ